MKQEYSAVTCWHEGSIHLDVSVPGFKSYEEAEKFAMQDLDLVLHIIEDEVVLSLITQVEEIKLERSQVLIRYDKRAQERKPLDPREPEQFKTILEALKTPDSIYHISDEDLEVQDWSFDNLVKILKPPIRFSSLAYGVDPYEL